MSTEKKTDDTTTIKLTRAEADVLMLSLGMALAGCMDRAMFVHVLRLVNVIGPQLSPHFVKYRIDGDDQEHHTH